MSAADVVPFRVKPIGAGGRLTRAATVGALDRSDQIAERIRSDRGNPWPAAAHFGISYSHACRIRAGWRPGGRRAAAVPFRTKGWVNGRRNGWASQDEAREAEVGA